MLKKLLKYELLATGRIILPFYAGLLGLTILFRLFSAFDTGFALREVRAIVEGLTVTAFVVLMISTFVVCFIIMLMRFYKNLFSDEGYLMHTLPVSPAANIWAKALSSALWTVTSVLVGFLCGFIFFFGDMLPELGSAVSRGFAMLRSELSAYFSIADSALLGIMLTLVIALMLLSLIAGPMLCYLCIALGQRFTRHKILGAFGVYLLISFLLQSLTAGLTAAATVTPLPRMMMRLMDANPLAAVCVMFAALLVWEIITTTVAFLITNHQLTHQLNLE